MSANIIAEYALSFPIQNTAEAVDSKTGFGSHEVGLRGGPHPLRIASAWTGVLLMIICADLNVYLRGLGDLVQRDAVGMIDENRSVDAFL